MIGRPVATALLSAAEHGRGKAAHHHKKKRHGKAAHHHKKKKHRSGVTHTHGTRPAPGAGHPVLFGDRTVESSIDKNAGGRAQAFPFINTSTASASSIVVFVASHNKAKTLVAGLYADDSGGPGLLVASGSLTSPKPRTWNSVSIAPTAIKPGKYWLAVLGEKGTLYIRDRRSGPCTSKDARRRHLAALPSSWQSGATSPNCRISAYVTGPVTAPVSTGAPGVATTLTFGGLAGPGAGSSIGGCNGCWWNGDFLTGSFKQYSGLDGPSQNFSLVQSNPTPPAPFKYAFDSGLNASAATPGEGGERALVALYPNTVPTQSSAPTRAYAGATTWYRDEIYLPSSYTPASNTNWNWMFEIHNAPDSAGIPMLSCGVDTSTNTTMTPNSDGGGAVSPARFSCRIVGGGNVSNPFDGSNSSNWSQNPAVKWTDLIGLKSITRGAWYDMVWKISWSCTTGGSVSWWINGTQVGSYSGPTLEYVVNGEDGYPTNGCNQGYQEDGDYRPAGISTQADVFHAGTMNGPTAASIGENLP